MRKPLHTALGLLDGLIVAPGGDLSSLEAALRAMEGVLDAVTAEEHFELGDPDLLVRTRPTDVHTIVRDECQHHRKAAVGGVKIEVAVAPSVPPIAPDGTRLRQFRWQMARARAHTLTGTLTACRLWRRTGATDWRYGGFGRSSDTRGNTRRS